MKHENWNDKDIADQKGKVVIVTGSSSGIGYEAARVLANKNAEVIIAVRDLDKGNAAEAKIVAQNKNAIIKVMKLDLADLASVKSFADEFKGRFSRLDRLINNAGVMIPPYSKTVDGFELQFGTNHLGHFALTSQLFALLAQTVEARVVNVSSGAHRIGKIAFDDLDWSKRGYSAWGAYGMSKIANLYFTYELDRRAKAAGMSLIANAAHPGWTATELQRNTLLARLGNYIFAQDVSMGALPTLRAAIDPHTQGSDYFGPSGLMEICGYPVKVSSNALSHDTEIAARLWEVSESLTGGEFAVTGKIAAASS